MIIRGHITHLHTAPLTTKRGTTTLTAIRVLDDHTHTTHGGQPGARHSPTRYELQFIDSKHFDWSTTLDLEFNPGDQILAYVEDTVRVQEAEGTPATLIVHGIDLGHSTQPEARRNP